MSSHAASPAAIEAAPVSGGPVTGYARGVAVLVLALGVLGLVPGITSNYDAMGFFRSDAHLFGLFTSSVVSASLQILFALTILTFSGSPRQAHKTVVWVGIAYLVAGLAGAGMIVNSPSSDLPVNIASNWLHLALGVVILAGSGATKKKHVDEFGVF